MLHNPAQKSLQGLIPKDTSQVRSSKESLDIPHFPFETFHAYLEYQPSKYTSVFDDVPIRKIAGTDLHCKRQYAKRMDGHNTVPVTRGFINRLRVTSDNDVLLETNKDILAELNYSTKFKQECMHRMAAKPRVK